MGKVDAKEKYAHFVPEVKKIDNWYKNFKFVLVKSIDELKGVFSKINPDNFYISFDTETTGLDFEKLDLVGYSFCLDGKTAYYVPVNHYKYGNSLDKEATDIIYYWMCKAKKVFMFNARYDMRVFEYIGYKDHPEIFYKDNRNWCYYDMSKVNYYDVAIPCWLADTNKKLPSLKWSSRHFLGIEQMHFDEVVEQVDNFYYLNPEDNPAVTFYAASDALCTYLLVPATAKYFKEGGFASKIDNMFLYPLMHFEENKIWIDEKKLDEMCVEADIRINELEKEVYDMIGYRINLNSPVQVAQAFQRLGIDTGERTASGSMSTGMKVLEKLPDVVKEKYPALKSYIEYKETFKLRSSYLNVLEKEVKSRGFVRGAYKNTEVPTGRLAAGKDGKNTYFTPMNLQALPKPHVYMEDVFDLGDRTLFSRKDNIILGYQFVESKYDENKNHIIPESTENRRYMGQSEGMNPYLNIRSLFTAKFDKDEGEDDTVYVSCDFAAEELRLAANISREPAWMNAFIEGRDVHQSTAEAVWGKENYNRDYRKKAKACFSINSYFLTKNGYIKGTDLGGKSFKSEYSEDTRDINDLGLLDLNGNPQRASYFVEDRPGYEVELSNGQVIEVTEDHKFLMADTFENNVWETINDSLIGRSVVLNRNNVYGNYQDVILNSDRFNKKKVLKFDERLAYLCGLYLGDGSIDLKKTGGGTCVLVKKDNLEYVKGILEDFGKCGVSTENGWYILRENKKQLVEFIYNNFGKTKTKHIGDIVFKSPKTVILSLLAGLLDSDGKINSNAIMYQSTNLNLIRDVSRVVTYLGYTVISFLNRKGVLKSKYRKNSDEDYIVDFYELNIAYEQSIRDIPIRLKRSIDFFKDRKKSFIGYDILESDRVKFKTLGNYTQRGNFTDERAKRLSRDISEKIGDWRYKYLSYKIVSIKKKSIRAICLECEKHEYVVNNLVTHNCNFGILYGMGASSLFENPVFGFKTMAEADEFYEKFKKSLPTLFQWEDRVQRTARRKGTVYTYFGRPRRVKGYYDNRNFAFANRTAVNTQIQGTGGDILKIDMCRLWKNLFNNPKYKDDVRFIVTIHDEIGYGVHTKRLEEIVHEIIKNQQLILKEWPVPILTEPAFGWSIGRLYDFKYDKESGHFVPDLE